jgi:hypothetical protein
MPASESDSEFDSIPEKFSGSSKAKLGVFLAELGRTFKHQPETFSSDLAKVRFAVSRLRGGALKWALEQSDWQSFEQFKTDLCDRFGNPDKAAVAAAQVKKLKQHGSARAYAARFKEYAADVEWGADKTQPNKWFYRGLKDDVRDSLMSTDWDWKMDHAAFIEKCIKIDEKIHPPHIHEQVNNYDH